MSRNHIYTTKGIILKSFNSGEANKVYLIFTEDLGLIRTTAQGVRLQKSKLKAHLGDFYLAYISVVKGREIWRLTSSEAISQGIFLRDIEKLKSVKNIFSLVLRLVHGEEKNEKLWLALESFYHFISYNNLGKNEIHSLEVLIVMKILNALGYLKTNPIDFEGEVTGQILSEFEAERLESIKIINQALKETHL